ncbi:glucan endo-1,3-beta-glucosidase [Salix suchowensis]|nr:glucan endo-1,3-beta-glucosidase [Salix suchowensis]
MIRPPSTIRFFFQFIVKSFTIRRAMPFELLKVLSYPPTNKNNNYNKILSPSTTGFLPTNFNNLAHHAWHTLTLGLGTKKSKILSFVFRFESMKLDVDRIWPSEIPLREVRDLNGCEMARFMFRKGCITFYVCNSPVLFLEKSETKENEKTKNNRRPTIPNPRSLRVKSSVHCSNP